MDSPYFGVSGDSVGCKIVFDDYLFLFLILLQFIFKNVN
jgi:hypothetical protein